MEDLLNQKNELNAKINTYDPTSDEYYEFIHLIQIIERKIELLELKKSIIKDTKNDRISYKLLALKNKFKQDIDHYKKIHEIIKSDEHSRFLFDTNNEKISYDLKLARIKNEHEINMQKIKNRYDINLNELEKINNQKISDLSSTIYDIDKNMIQTCKHSKLGELDKSKYGYCSHCGLKVFFLQDKILF